MSNVPGAGASHVVHAAGSTAERLEDNARKLGAAFFECDPGDVIFDPYTTDSESFWGTTGAHVTVRLAVAVAETGGEH